MMIWLSELLIQEHQLESFADLQQLLQRKAAAGALHFGMDVKPQFADTPSNWETVLESVFSARY